MKMARPRDKGGWAKTVGSCQVVERWTRPLTQVGDSHSLPGGHLWGKAGPVSPEEPQSVTLRRFSASTGRHTANSKTMR